MQQKKKLIRSILIAICLAISGSCADDSLFESQPENTLLTDNISVMRNYFESTATTLSQINRQNCEPSCDHDHSHGHTRSKNSSTNLVPDWKQVRTWENDTLLYLEVPIKGDGVYQSAYLDIGRRRKAHPARSYLVLVSNKKQEKISYHVVTAVVETNGKKKPREENFQYVGNKNFKGYLLYSSVDGTSLRALHMHKHKIHPIQIGKRLTATTRIQAEPSNIGSAGQGYVLSLTSAVARYWYDEPGGGWSGDDDDYGFGGVVYCAICQSPYDVSAGRCPNNCGVDVGGNKGNEDWRWILPCIKCGEIYSTLYYSSCPFCSEPDPIPIIPPWNGGGGGSGGGGYSGGTEEDEEEDDDECTGEKCKICGGYKAATRSSSNCPVCICVVYNVNLVVMTSMVEAPNSYPIIVYVRSSNNTPVSVDRVAYQMQRTTRNGNWVTVNEQSGSKETRFTYNRKAWTPGFWKVRAIVYFPNGDSKTTNEISVEEQFPSINRFGGDIGLLNHLSGTLWTDAVNYAREHQSTHEVREYGCLVYLRRNGTYYAGPTIEGPPVLLTIPGTYGTVPYNYSDTPYDPRMDDTDLVVGTMHTHYPMTWAPARQERRVGASPDDINAILPGIGYDYASYLYAGHNVNDAKASFTHGPVRRATTR